MLKKILTNTLVIIISCIVALLIGEGALRLVYKDLPQENWGKKLFCRNQKFNYRFMVPGGSGLMFSEEFPSIPVSANSYGYRDSDWKSKKGKKLMVLGDSFGWGWGCNYDNTLVHIIDSMLGDDWATYNLCIPGDDIFRIYSRYRYFDNIIKPDHILILNYVNDFYDPQEQTKEMKESEALYKSFDGTATCDYFYDKTFKDYINDYSYIYRLVNRIRSMGGISFTSKQKQQNLLRKGFEPDIKLLTSDERISAGVAMYMPVLREMAANHKVTVVNIPAAYEVDKDKMKQIASLFELNGNDLNGINNALKSNIDSAQNMQFIELLPMLKEENAKNKVYFAQDAHLNSKGQVVSGTYIANILKTTLNQ